MNNWERSTRIHEFLFKYQAKQHSKLDIYKLIQKDNLQGLKEFLFSEKLAEINRKEPKEILKMTDCVGYNVVHVAYLMQKYEIGRWLVKNFPDVAIQPCSKKCSAIVMENAKMDRLEISDEDMPYAGQNILHLTIIQRNHEETRWLLDFYTKHKYSGIYGLDQLLLGNVTGNFFSNKNGAFYYGCFPLHFAVCSNDTRMFDLILAYTSSLDEDKEATKNGARCNLGTSVIFMRDQHGNNCLHLAVIHKLKDMYAHIKRRAECILEKQILIAYTNNFLKESPEDAFYLPSLPKHDEVIIYGIHSEHEENGHEEKKTKGNGFHTGYAPQERKLRPPKVETRSDVQLDKWLKDETSWKLE